MVEVVFAGRQGLSPWRCYLKAAVLDALLLSRAVERRAAEDLLQRLYDEVLSIPTRDRSDEEAKALSGEGLALLRRRQERSRTRAATQG